MTNFYYKETRIVENASKSILFTRKKDKGKSTPPKLFKSKSVRKSNLTTNKNLSVFKTELENSKQSLEKILFGIVRYWQDH